MAPRVPTLGRRCGAPGDDDDDDDDEDAPPARLVEEPPALDRTPEAPAAAAAGESPTPLRGRVTRPAVGVHRPASTRNMEVFPAPLAPVTMMFRPGTISRLKSWGGGQRGKHREASMDSVKAVG